MQATTEEFEVAELVKKLVSGNEQALARVLSYIEDADARASKCLEQLYKQSGHSYVIGITGSPGAGKSTLVDGLADLAAEQGQRVAILAIDPSSPFTGGALLGDRIRMSKAASRSKVFIRSMASRGALGGLSPHSAEAIFALDAAGFDYIFVETVGVGQAEVEIVRTADTVVVVVVPGLGDGVQALKAGILEIADVFSLNKADYQGADRLERDLRTMLQIGPKLDWTPEIVSTVATEGKGVAELFSAIIKHRTWSEKTGARDKRRKQFLTETFYRYLTDESREAVLKLAQTSGLLEHTLNTLLNREMEPRLLAKQLVEKVLKSDRFVA